MPQFGKKKSYTDWLYTRPVLVFLGFLILFVGYAVFERWSVEQDMSARRAEAEAERNAALVRMADLQEKVDYLEGERGIEEEIRKHFDVAREGETVVILTGEPESETSEVATSTAPAPRWYQFWR